MISKNSFWDTFPESAGKRIACFAHCAVCTVYLDLRWDLIRSFSIMFFIALMWAQIPSGPEKFKRVFKYQTFCTSFYSGFESVANIVVSIETFWVKIHLKSIYNRDCLSNYSIPARFKIDRTQYARKYSSEGRDITKFARLHSQKMEAIIRKE